MVWEAIIKIWDKIFPWSAGSNLLLLLGFFSPTLVTPQDVILKRVCSPHVPLSTGLGIYFKSNQAQVLQRVEEFSSHVCAQCETFQTAMFGELANNSIFLCKRKLKVNQSVFCSPTRGHVVQLGNVCCRTVVRPLIMLQCQYYLFKHLHFPKSKFIKKKKGVPTRVQNCKRLNLRVELMGDFY